MRAGKVVIVQNHAPFEREEWVHVPVPFDQGEFPADGGPGAELGGLPTVWQPFGARWEDGSVRHAVALARVRVGAIRETSMPVEHAGEPQAVAPHAFSRGVAAAAERLRFELVAVTGGEERIAGLRPVRVLEANAARLVTLHRSRVPGTMLWFEVILSFYADQDLVPFEAAVYCSDPTSAALTQPLDRLAFRVAGALPLVRYWMRRGVSLGPPPAAPGTTELVLMEKSHFGDGQGQRYAGSLLFEPAGEEPDLALRRATLSAETQHPLLACARWQGTRAYGPFGVIPELPPWLATDGGRGAILRSAAEFARRNHERGDPWAAPELGLAKYAGQTGHQADFGVIKLWPVAATGNPSLLLAAELSVLQEACRPTHYFEADGELTDPARHPRWVVWSGRTHWHPGVSPDRLGKPEKAPETDFHGWSGKDSQHWSSLYLCGFHLLTGSFGALREIEHEAMLYLASQTVQPGLSTSGTDAARAVGRTLLTASWLYLCTGDERIRQRMVDRIEQVIAPNWDGGRVSGEIRPLVLDGPDPRYHDPDAVVWVPWQDALGVVGLAAASRVTGNRTALAIAKAVARSVCLYAFEDRGDGVQIAASMTFRPGGEPFTPAELAERGRYVGWGENTDYALWALPCVMLGLRWAKEAGDDAWRARCEDLLRRIRRRRGPPRDGGFDSFGEWEAVG